MVRRIATAWTTSLVALPCVLGAVLGACSANSPARNLVNETPENNTNTGGVTGIIIGQSGTANINTAGGTSISQQVVTTRTPWPDSGTAWHEASVTVTDPGSRFAASPAGSPKPTWVYPFNESMHPRNLVNVSFLWNKAVPGSNDLFRIVVTTPDSKTYYLYFSCVASLNACAKPQNGSSGLPDLPDAEWFDLGKKYAGQAVTLTLQETSSTGGTVYQSDPLQVYFSPDEVLGTLYYWAAADWSIKRANFGAREAVRFVWGKSAANAFSCQACHSVSRDGSAIAFAVSERDGENTSAIQTSSTQSPDTPWVRPSGPGQTPYTAPELIHSNDPAYASPVTQGPLDHFGQNVALSPDGKFAAINGIGDPPLGNSWRFEVWNAQTGANVQTWMFQSNAGPILPEYSPDGEYIAVTMTSNSPQGCAWTYATCAGGISVIKVDRATGQMQSTGIPITEPQSGHFHYYPTWSPDMRYLAFVDAPACAGTASCKSDKANNGVLYMVKTTEGLPHRCPGDPSCIELARGGQFSAAMQGGGQAGIHSTMPKFTPYAQGPTGNVMFISFSSKMNYGWNDNKNGNQIWMFGIDVSRSGDPSYAPIWLPYQKPTDGSLAPFWAATAPCQSAAGGGCSGCRTGETCLVNEVTNTCSCAGGVVN